MTVRDVIEGALPANVLAELEVTAKATLDAEVIGLDGSSAHGEKCRAVVVTRRAMTAAEDAVGVDIEAVDPDETLAATLLGKAYRYTVVHAVLRALYGEGGVYEATRVGTCLEHDGFMTVKEPSNRLAFVLSDGDLVAVLKEVGDA